MSSFSSSRVSSSPQSSPRPPHRSDVGLGSRPRPASETATSHGFRHRQPSTSAGSRGRYQDWDQEDGLPPSSILRDFSPRTPIAGSPAGHASSPSFVARTPPSISKVRTNPRAHSSHNEVSPASRMSGLGRWPPGIQAHQSQHAPNGCTTSLPPLLLAKVPPASLNEPPSLSSSPTSPAPSLRTPRTPQSKHSPLRVRRCSAFVTPSASFSSFRPDTRSCEDPHSKCERRTASPSPLSHASHEPRSSSHR